MRLNCYAMFAAFLSASVALAGNVAPSEESIRELFRITNVRTVLDQMLPQMDLTIKDTMKRVLQEQEMNAAQEEVIERMTKRVSEVMKEELDWGRLEPIYIGIYREALTQEEVDGMLEFYRTPAGEAVINKMPLVMRKSMAAVQQRMGPMMEKMQEIREKALTELQEKMKK